MSSYDLVCLSHLRWDFVYQRPQHLLSRFAREHRTFYVEEPRPTDGSPYLEVRRLEDGPLVVVPRVPDGLAPDEHDSVQRELLGRLLEGHRVSRFVLWYYTPMAISWTNHLRPLASVYDCMDELSAFAGASRLLPLREAQLFETVDVVFTGGPSLYERKSVYHSNVFLFPSSVDVPHFRKARQVRSEPSDQAAIKRPRIGYCGVIDERMDQTLLDALAAERPSWQFVLVGPIAKVDRAALPNRPNLHYLGQKPYEDLPDYLAGWDVAMLPFARNESTRYISPTKTPEYLAAGTPVVATPIRDVIRPYGERGFVRIAESPSEFITAIESALDDRGRDLGHEIDAFLAESSWEKTWLRMKAIVDEEVSRRGALTERRTGAGTGADSQEGAAQVSSR